MATLIRKFIPRFLASSYHYFLALAGAIFYGFPSRRLVVIGITGTKGKSTTVMLTGKILEEAGFKVGWISSATLKIGEREWLTPYHMTMPGRFVIQRLMEKMVEAGCKYCLIEVTSEGIVQHRHRFINFDTAVFLNLRPEHIEAHGSFEKYRQAKGNLFEITNKMHILNLDDENAEYFLAFPAIKKCGYSVKASSSKLSILSQFSNINLQTVFAKDVGEQGKVKFLIDNTEFNINLLGKFNIYNSLAAICIGLSQGVGLDICKKALEKIKEIPGRMEIVIEKPFLAIVDLAHTPDSFEGVFKSAKELTHDKIISVFGSAGGGRDKWKRPVLGKIAAENSDFIILTNEDPYDEKPDQILSQIKSGIINFPASSLVEILDRREAIRKALEMAREGDIVLILGKGTEQSMIIGSKKIPWDDRKIVKEEYALLKKQ